MSGRWYIGAGIALALAFAVTYALQPWSNTLISDVPLFAAYANDFAQGRLPYSDVAFEYPPLAAPLIALPELFDDYRAAFAGLTLLLALGTLLLTGSLARLTGGDERVALAAVALSPLLAGAMIRTHFDLAPLVLTLAGLAALISRRPALGFALLGLGAMTKGFPLVVAPVALAWLVARGERRAALRGAVTLTVTLVAVGVAAVALSPSGALDAVTYQFDRPLQVESGPATAVRAIAALGGESVTPVASHKSNGLTHPSADLAAATFAGALAGLVVFLALAAARRPADPRRLVLASLAAVAGFALFGKVLSPQFMIWTIPLMALAAAWREWLLAGALATAIALTLAWFPSRYFDLVDLDPLPVGMMVARNLLLLAAIGLAGRALLLARPEPGEARVSAPAAEPAR